MDILQHVISLSEFKSLDSDTQIVVLDVRTEAEHLEGHIPGAVRMEIDDILTHLPSIPDSILLVTACRNGGNRSKQAAQVLLEAGRQAKWLEGGNLGFLNSKD